MRRLRKTPISANEKNFEAPAEIRVFKMHFTISRPRSKKNAQPGAEAAFPAALAIGAIIGLHGQKRI
jgi:hypothetical protein